MPKFSVIVPVYNGASFLRQSIESVLAQTYTDFELIVIDDFSDDNSYEIARSFNDKRLKVFQNKQNLGPGKTRNYGLDVASGKYIALLDADDICFPCRLEKQSEFLDENPKIGLCGSWAKTSGNPNLRFIRHVLANGELKSALLFYSPFVTSSIAFRSELIRIYAISFPDRYFPGFHAEDYSFWVKCMDKTQFANIPEYLISYQYHSSQLTSKNHAIALKNSSTVWKEVLHKLGLDYSGSQILTHSKFSEKYSPDLSSSDLREMSAWLIDIYTRNEQTGLIPKLALRHMLALFWMKACLRVRHKDSTVWKQFCVIDKHFSFPGRRKKVELFAECLMGNFASFLR